MNILAAAAALGRRLRATASPYIEAESAVDLDAPYELPYEPLTPTERERVWAGIEAAIGGRDALKEATRQALLDLEEGRAVPLPEYPALIDVEYDPPLHFKRRVIIKALYAVLPGTVAPPHVEHATASAFDRALWQQGWRIVRRDAA